MLNTHRYKHFKFVEKKTILLTSTHILQKKFIGDKTDQFLYVIRLNFSLIMRLSACVRLSDFIFEPKDSVEVMSKTVEILA
jgi:hypothetical protein